MEATVTGVGRQQKPVEEQLVRFIDKVREIVDKYEGTARVASARRDRELGVNSTTLASKLAMLERSDDSRRHKLERRRRLEETKTGCDEAALRVCADAMDAQRIAFVEEVKHVEFRFEAFVFSSGGRVVGRGLLVAQAMAKELAADPASAPETMNIWKENVTFLEGMMARVDRAEEIGGLIRSISPAFA